MIFTFWTSDPANNDTPQVPESTLAWQQIFPRATVYSVSDVLQILSSFGVRYLDLFKKIQIPACQSDLARLLLLYNFGGLYVDSHTGPGDKSDLLNIFSYLSAYETVIFEKPWERKSEGDLHIINTVIAARKQSDVIKILIQSALRNLEAHYELECRTQDYIPYNIFVLTGAWDIRVNLLTVNKNKLFLKDEYTDRVKIYNLSKTPDSGLHLYKFYSYRKPGRHWSERQKVEKLFA